MTSSNRDELRKYFFESWRKFQNKQPLEPLEKQIVAIILQHPEHHALLNNPEKFQHQDFGEDNPFLHLSLHLAIEEQIQTNRPHGIKQIYDLLCQSSDKHEVLHQMMECLSAILWEAQQSGKMPDEGEYLERLKNNSHPRESGDLHGDPRFRGDDSVEGDDC